MPGIRTVKIDKIELDADIQPRVQMSQATIDEYTAALVDGAKLPPVVIYRDGDGTNRLADGFNRVMAHRTARMSEINAEIRQGGKRDAILFAVGANTTHGQRRSNADKRRAVETMLADPEWSTWSDRQIAEKCYVGHPLVAEIRAESVGSSSTSTRVGKDGKSYPAKPPATEQPKRSQVNGHAAHDPPDVAKARANGKIPVDAVVTVTEPDPEPVQPPAPEADHPDDQSDEDWLAALPLDSKLDGRCLKDFRVDALSYRSLEGPRATFKRQVSMVIQKHARGEFAYRVKSFLAIDHPKDWVLCTTPENGGCSGAGLVGGLNLQCPACHGRGYRINK